MAGSPGRRWWEHDAAPGVLLLLAAFISFGLQNSAAAGAFDAALHVPVAARLGPFALSLDLAHFIADGLMAVFFLYVGLELKRESVEGPFQNTREAALPMLCAVGGMAAPALVYIAIAAPFDLSYVRGWAVPAATDIAFALGALSLLGSRVSTGLRLFILALAVADDLGAIIIIALFYSQSIAGWALGGAVVSFLAMLLLNRLGVYRLGPYWILAFICWAFMLASGVHATIAGVLTAFAIPMRRPDGRSPLISAEHELKPWVLLGIMPVFALANAGAPLNGAGFSAFAHPVTLAVAVGLALGKPLGIFGAALLGVRVLKLPSAIDMNALLGASMIAGIGFTMSLFIGGLAFGDGPLAAPMRIGVLIGSALSAGLGLALLRARLAPAKPAAA